MKTGTFSDIETYQKENPKPTIIHIFTDWCSVCKIESFQLKKDKDLVKMLNESFYLINFEAEKTKEKSVFRGRILVICLMEIPGFMSWLWLYPKIKISLFIRCGLF
ncbi:hypothetical protein [Chryseobacterium wanjuense]